MSSNLLRGVVAGALLAGGWSAVAAESGGWKFEVTPYAWLAGMEGDVTINGREAEFEKSASDLLDAVELGGSLRIGAEYNRFVIGALVDYFSLSTDELDVEDQPQGGKLETKTLMTEAALGYRVDGWAENQSFVFAVGVRSLALETDLTPKGHETTSKDNDITDGMFYVLPSMPLFASSIDGLRFNPVLGIGAGDSDLAYEMFPQIQYQVSDQLAVRFGYRTVGWKFKGDHNEDNELNTSLSGLILGAGLTF